MPKFRFDKITKPPVRFRIGDIVAIQGITLATEPLPCMIITVEYNMARVVRLDCGHLEEGFIPLSDMTRYPNGTELVLTQT